MNDWQLIMKIGKHRWGFHKTPVLFKIETHEIASWVMPVNPEQCMSILSNACSTWKRGVACFIWFSVVEATLQVNRTVLHFLKRIWSTFQFPEKVFWDHSFGGGGRWCCRAEKRGIKIIIWPCTWRRCCYVTCLSVGDREETGYVCVQCSDLWTSNISWKKKWVWDDHQFNSTKA